MVQFNIAPSAGVAAGKSSVLFIDSGIAKVAWLLYNVQFIFPHSSARSLDIQPGQERWRCGPKVVVARYAITPKRNTRRYPVIYCGSTHSRFFFKESVLKMRIVASDEER